MVITDATMLLEPVEPIVVDLLREPLGTVGSPVGEPAEEPDLDRYPSPHDAQE